LNIAHPITATEQPIEIAVVYYRAGYAPTDYIDLTTDYNTRALLERSRAIQCPSLALQLAGGKKVQEVLARPGVLERFGIVGKQAEDIRETWVGMWGLDAREEGIPPGVGLESIKGDDKNEPAGTKLARIRADALVLKPQREGGGNNIYRSAIGPFLDTLPAPERAAWIAMELIRTPFSSSADKEEERGFGGYLVRSGEPGAVKARVVSEIGIFGWALFGQGDTGGEEEDLKEDTVGWLVRTKASGVDEGGVAAGFSVLDSVLLVD
jgi:glutathione synthase